VYVTGIIINIIMVSDDIVNFILKIWLKVDWRYHLAYMWRILE
jgi:hypothetical protein